MSRLTKLRRRAIYRLGEMLFPENEPKEGPEAEKKQRKTAILQIAALLLLTFAVLYLGGRSIYHEYISRKEPMAVIDSYQKELEEKRILHEHLQSENSNLQDQFMVKRNEMLLNLNLSSPENEQLLEEYRQALVMAGMTEYQGSGIRITIQDKAERSEDVSRAILQIVHDADIRYIVDWLKQHYVTALAVNNERLAPMSPLICTGPSVLVNRVYKASPFVIEAGGDPAVLETFVESSGYMKFKERGLLVSVEPVMNLTIPAQKDMTYVNAQVAKLEAKK